MLKEARSGPRLLHILLIVAATVAFYTRSCDNYWIKDDLLIGQFTTEGELDWSQYKKFAWPSHMEREQFWRPLPILLGFVDYSLWGTDPMGYHVQNLLWQALVGVLLYLFLLRIAGPRARTAAFFGGLFLVINPGGAEAVVWTLQRMVLMNAALSLGALLAWLKAAETGQLRWRIAGLVLLTLSILSKEIAVVLPASFFLIDLLFGPAGTSWKKRAKTAFLWTVPNAVLLAAYLGIRFLLWGRFDLKYAGLEPAEYAALNRVFERMGASLGHGFLPVNAAVFGETITLLLRSLMGFGFLLAAGFGLFSFVRSREFRRGAILLTATGVLAFLPTLYIFWIDEYLFNARLFYLPALTAVALAALSLGMVGREGSVDIRSRVSSWGLAGFGAITLGFSVSLAGHLTAFEAAGNQVRGIQQATLRYADGLREEGIEDPVIVAFNTPSVAEGVPTLETSLQHALRRPLIDRDLKVIPLLETLRNPKGAGADTRIWWKQLSDRRAATGTPWSQVHYVNCEYQPPGVTPIFAVMAPAEGAAAEVIAPEDGLALPNDAEAPVFEFEVPEGAASFVLVIDTNDGRRFEFGIRPGDNAILDGQRLRYDLAVGDPRKPELAGAWKKALGQFLPEPVPLRWRLLSKDAGDRVIGAAEERRLMIINVLPRP